MAGSSCAAACATAEDIICLNGLGYDNTESVAIGEAKKSIVRWSFCGFFWQLLQVQDYGAVRPLGAVEGFENPNRRYEYEPAHTASDRLQPVKGGQRATA